VKPGQTAIVSVKINREAITGSLASLRQRIGARGDWEGAGESLARRPGRLWLECLDPAVRPPERIVLSVADRSFTAAIPSGLRRPRIAISFAYHVAAHYPHPALRRRQQCARISACGALSAWQTIIQRVRLLGRQPGSNLAHDRNDFLHDITAGGTIAPLSKYPTAARISALASSAPANSQSS
jgi:hypothetical protein